MGNQSNRMIKRMISILVAVTLCIPATATTMFGAETTYEPTSTDVLPRSYSSSSKIPSSIVVEKKGNYVTSVKDIGGYGLGWAEAAMSLAESSILIDTGTNPSTNKVNFNEYHLAYYTYHTPKDPLSLFGGDTTENHSGRTDLFVGGNLYTTVVNFANWIGPSKNKSFDADDVLSGKKEGSTNFAFSDGAHLENAYILSMPDMSDKNYKTDMDVIKEMIMEEGGVAISYYATTKSTYWKDGYQYVTKNLDEDHSATIVGWSDDIPASAFAKRPAGDGAWLVKGNWGKDFGLNGYFWLSYYDKSISAVGYVFDFTTAENYENNYQYDGGTNLLNTKYYYENVTMANAFVADSKENIKAVGFYTMEKDVDYEVRVYRDLEAGAAPNAGTLVLAQKGMQSYAGFHTLELETPVLVEKGERYAIVITLSNKGKYVGVALDETSSWEWVDFYSYAKEGESYIGSSVKSLKDMNPGNGSHVQGTNLRIKAFTDEYGEMRKAENGNWYYYIDGKIAKNYNGVVAYKTGLYYISKGKWDKSKTGIYKRNDQWYLFKEGRVRKNYTGMAKRKERWYYIENGLLNFDYDGIAIRKGKLYYVEDSRIDFSKTGIYRRSDKVYYFEKGRVKTTYTGLKQKGKTVFYFRKGQQATTFTGIAKGEDGKRYYVKKGKVDFSKTGNVKFRGNTYKVVKGVATKTK